MNRHALRILTLSFALLAGSCTLFRTEPPDGDYFQRQTGPIRVYFTQPGYDAASGRDAGVQDRIAELVDSAKNSVDICIYELSEPTIYNAVLRAYRRGVRVRFVGDIDNINYSGYQALMSAGTPMRLGNRDSIMHDKYIIVDERWLVMGSMNYTTTGAFNNNENVLFFDSPAMCAYYKKDFETMFSNNLFGLDKIDHKFAGFDTNWAYITNEDGTTTRVDMYVIPYVGYEGQNDGTRVDYRFMDYVNSAQHSIHFAIFAFTHPDIAMAMINLAKTKGIQVYGIFDKSWHTANEYSLHQEFIDALTETSNIHIVYDGNENYLIGNPLHGGKCHNKFMIVDAGYSNAVVVTGSYNFSKAASYKGNDENFVAVHSRALSLLYLSNFVAMYNIGQHPTRDLGGDIANYHDATISEILWAGSRNILGQVYDSDKFVEIHNNTGHDINISGWQLTGTTAVSKSYRIIMYIFPENTVLPAGGYRVVFYSTNTAFNMPGENVDPFLFLYHPDDQNYVFLTLKDSYNRIVDEAGSRGAPPFAGTMGELDSSMLRIGDDGTLSSSWESCVSVNAFLRNAFRLNTKATPGTP